MSDTPAARSARPRSKVIVFLRLLGSLLCVDGAALMVGAELAVLLQQAAIEAQYAACVAPYQPSFLPPEDITGPQQGVCLGPAAITLLVIGVRVLLGKSPGIAPPAATLLGIGGAIGMCALWPLPVFLLHHSYSPCSIPLAGRDEWLFWIGVLAGLVGSIVLSRTTQYRRLRLEDG